MRDLTRKQELFTPLTDRLLDMVPAPSTDPRPETLQELLTEHKWDEIKPILGLIPQDEADFIELTVHLGKCQRAVAEIFHCSQQHVGLKLQRAIERIQYWLKKPKLDLPVIEVVLTRYVTRKAARALVLLFEHNSLIVVQNIQGYKQISAVEHYLVDMFPRLRSCTDPDLQPFIQFMDWVIRNKKWNLQRVVPIHPIKVINPCDLEYVNCTGDPLETMFRCPTEDVPTKIQESLARVRQLYRRDLEDVCDL